MKVTLVVVVMRVKIIIMVDFEAMGVEMIVIAVVLMTVIVVWYY